MLNTAQKNKIEEIREAVSNMLDVRAHLEATNIFQPSEFWKLMNRYLSYIRELSADQLENIRCHIGMGFFLGNPWHKEFYDGFNIDTDTAAAQTDLIGKFDRFSRDVPEQYWCSENAINDLVSSIGIKYKGKIVNLDIVKEQACIQNLYNLGLIGKNGNEFTRILELGPGYGQLTFQLSRMLGTHCRFICVDYPETLFWSSTFLAVNSDPKEIYLWKSSDKHIDILELSKQYRFVMIPNYAIEALGDTPAFDLVINQNSFQEMSEKQVEFYADYLSRTTSGWLYSYNERKQFMNNELHKHVEQILGEHFIGAPSDAEYAAAGIDLREQNSKRLFLGYSKRLKSPPSRENRSNVAWVKDKPIQVKF